MAGRLLPNGSSGGLWPWVDGLRPPEARWRGFSRWRGRARHNHIHQYGGQIVCCDIVAVGVGRCRHAMMGFIIIAQ